LLFARRLEVPVVLTDIDQGRLDKGVAYVHREVDKLLAKKRISADAANRLKAAVTGSLTKDAFADADLVIEAVFEDMTVKQKVLAELEAVVRPETLLLTNTSALSVSEMDPGSTGPNVSPACTSSTPVAIMPLVEVVRAVKTDDTSVATTIAVAKKLKKNAVLVADAPAFVVNRLLIRFMGEILGSIADGADVEEADHAVDGLGLPMSPLELLALVGPAVALHVAETMHAAFPDRFRNPSGLARLVAAGKTGVYTAGPDGKPVIDAEAARLLREGGGGDGRGAAGGLPAPTGDQVRATAAEALAQEIRILLDTGVVAEAPDVDLCMILGAGWPFHLGGITPTSTAPASAKRSTAPVSPRRESPPSPEPDTQHPWHPRLARVLVSRAGVAHYGTAAGRFLPSSVDGGHCPGASLLPDLGFPPRPGRDATDLRRRGPAAFGGRLRPGDGCAGLRRGHHERTPARRPVRHLSGGCARDPPRNIRRPTLPGRWRARTHVREGLRNLCSGRDLHRGVHPARLPAAFLLTRAFSGPHTDRMIERARGDLRNLARPEWMRRALVVERVLGVPLGVISYAVTLYLLLRIAGGMWLVDFSYLLPALDDHIDILGISRHPPRASPMRSTRSGHRGADRRHRPCRRRVT
jgi:3-hydroxyacyl-CoA dehydrogenase